MKKELNNQQTKTYFILNDKVGFYFISSTSPCINPIKKGKTKII